MANNFSPRDRDSRILNNKGISIIVKRYERKNKGRTGHYPWCVSRKYYDEKLLHGDLLLEYSYIQRRQISGY